ncbi:MAG: DUF4174 domain-containing protein [Flavobacteriaceae bacterium]|nr:DUF4174 domain-containing protein [Flavobacteriaceae bacterium]
MKRRTVFNGLLVLVLGVGLAMAQKSELEHYKWENRLVLIFSEGLEDDKFLNQIKEFEDVDDELSDRKLLLIHVQRDNYKFLNRDTSHDNMAISFSGLFKKHMKGEEDFKLLLIGLDGGIKLESSEIVKKQRLFDLIDSMPMRRTELRHKKKG